MSRQFNFIATIVVVFALFLISVPSNALAQSVEPTQDFEPTQLLGPAKQLELAFPGTQIAAPADSSQTSDVSVSANLKRISDTEAELLVDVVIADGLHIYAQSQPKPFLATRLTVKQHSPNIAAVGSFVADRKPIVLQDRDVDAELHEFKNTVQWRSKITLKGGGPVRIEGEVFAQACGEDSCFPPETYLFNAQLQPPPTKAPTSDARTESTSPEIADVNPPTLSPVLDTAPESSNESVVAVVLPPTPTITSGPRSSDVPFADHSAASASQSAHAQGKARTDRAVGDAFAPFQVADVDAKASTFQLAELQVDVSESKSAWTVMPLAFFAGFLLNFMPCVLPVVGLKLLSFVQQAGEDRKRILFLNLAYTAGLISVMLILATLAVFAGLGWGQQFSSKAFTVALSAVVFAFGLSFLGVWEIPLPGLIGDASATSKQEGYGGAFSKGVLSTLLATPCSGPFLGAALAWAVTQPTYLTYSVFAAVGLGMASPYLVIGVFPSLIRLLPKPGNWMVTFKQVMGFIMLATVVYLMSFIPVPSVVPTVWLLLGVGLAVWFASRTPAYAPVHQRIQSWAMAGIIIVGAVVSGFGWLEDIMQTRFERAAERLYSQSIDTNHSITSSATSSDTDIAWQPYTPERFQASIRSGRPVFIDFTADWCVTCKSNEIAAIETPAVATALRDRGIVALRADKTRPSPEIDQLLRQLGNLTTAIPFYAVFSPDRPNQPVLMDGVYASPAPFVAALESVGQTDRQPGIASRHDAIGNDRSNR